MFASHKLWGGFSLLWFSWGFFIVSLWELWGLWVGVNTGKSSAFSIQEDISMAVWLPWFAWGAAAALGLRRWHGFGTRKPSWSSIQAWCSMVLGCSCFSLGTWMILVGEPRCVVSFSLILWCSMCVSRNSRRAAFKAGALICRFADNFAIWRWQELTCPYQLHGCSNRSGERLERHTALIEVLGSH